LGLQLVLFAAAVLSSAALTLLFRDLAISRGWVSTPSSGRHIHVRPVPRLGGIAIFLTLWCMVLLSHWVPGHFGTGEMCLTRVALEILGPASIIFLIGLTDDFYGLSPYLKFGAQAGAAALLFVNGFDISQLSILAPHSQLAWLIGLSATILWVLWVTNAFNLIDGLDGLAAGCALLSTLVACVVAALSHTQGILFFTVILAGAIAGFLPYNFNPASIFLGDCGSLLIGFVLSAIAIAESQQSPRVAVVIPIVSLGFPILDVAVAVIRRFLSCRRLFDADREHIHHRLLGRGISHRRAVLLLYGVCACFGLLSLALLKPSGAVTLVVLAVVGIGVLTGMQRLRYPEFVELGRVANRTLNQRQVIANDIGIRRARDALGSCATAAQFCQILQRCLEPVGFDGFGLSLSSELPTAVELVPFTRAGRSELHFFWTHSLTSPETNWSLTFSLQKRSGERLGTFNLYRQNAESPLWIDLDVFTATGFSTAAAAVVENIQDAWFGRHTEQIQTPTFEIIAPTVMASRFRQSVGVPSSD
jgi:UDP-GlcNAc:undecaprenyl-phosphate/decaprenyl-phosphate GlcNAc-1-phosphate transferase